MQGDQFGNGINHDGDADDYGGRRADGVGVPVGRDDQRHDRVALDYRDKWLLAPMVHACVLPFRLTCLDNGADIVYSEEIVDKSLIDTYRYENEEFGTIEYINKTKKCLVYSTSRAEAHRNVLQLGTADPCLALRAATHTFNDVAAIDINMGCPKSFSVKGGMGAALLSSSHLAADILKTLTRNLPGQVTCKIRLLQSIPKTLEFMQLCERSGAAAIAVHLRQAHHRPSYRAQWDCFPLLKQAVAVPVVANGDFITATDITAFLTLAQSTTLTEPFCSNGRDDGDEESRDQVRRPDSIMIARGALANPAIFQLKAQLALERRRASSTRPTARTGRPVCDTTSTPIGLTNAVSSDAHSLSTAHGDGVVVDETRLSPPEAQAAAAEIPVPPKIEIIRQYVKKAIGLNSPYQSLRYIVPRMLEHEPSLVTEKRLVHTAKGTAFLCAAVGLGDWYDGRRASLPPNANTLKYYIAAADAHTGTAAGTHTGTTAEAHTGTTSEAHAGTTTEAQAGTTAEAHAGTTAEAHAGTTAEAHAGTTAEAHAGTTTEAHAATTTEAHAATTAEAQAGTTAEAQAGTDSPIEGEKHRLSCREGQNERTPKKRRTIFDVTVLENVDEVSD